MLQQGREEEEAEEEEAEAEEAEASACSRHTGSRSSCRHWCRRRRRLQLQQLPAWLWRPLLWLSLQLAVALAVVLGVALGVALAVAPLVAQQRRCWLCSRLAGVGRQALQAQPPVGRGAARGRQRLLCSSGRRGRGVAALSAALLAALCRKGAL
jgi:hypothetical protein